MQEVIFVKLTDNMPRPAHQAFLDKKLAEGYKVLDVKLHITVRNNYSSGTAIFVLDKP